MRERMTLIGYLSEEFDVKSPADEFFQACMQALGLPIYSGTMDIEEVEVRVMESKDEEETVEFSKKEETKFRMEEGVQISEWYKALTIDRDGVATWQNPDWYKMLEGTLSVSHVEGNDLGRGTWTIDYEKINPDIEVPQSIMDAFIKYFKKLDESLFATIN